MWNDEPTAGELERYFIEARRLRTQYLASLVRGLFAKLKTVCSRAIRGRRSEGFLQRGIMPRR
jgi:hypothetical protein